MLQIIVYVDPERTEKQSRIITTIDPYYNVFIDAVNGKNVQVLRDKYQGTCHRFFFVSEFVSMCCVDELDYIVPDFAIAFSNSVDVNEKQWVQIERYLESLFFPSSQVSGEMLLTAQKLLQPQQKMQAFVKPTKALDMKKDEFYNLILKELPDRDMILIQVDKPFCDLPYTVVIRKYSENGLRSFFTDLFICQSWGVCRKDYEFLGQVWKHWNMDGEMDLDQMLLAATQRCFPQENQQPVAEPEVYRRSIDEVLVGFEKRENGCTHEMKDPWNEHRMKKRRLEEDILLN